MFLLYLYLALYHPLFGNFRCSIEIHISDMSKPGQDQETCNKYRDNYGKQGNKNNYRRWLPDRYNGTWDTWDRQSRYMHCILCHHKICSTCTCSTRSRNWIIWMFLPHPCYTSRGKRRPLTGVFPRFGNLPDPLLSREPCKLSSSNHYHFETIPGTHPSRPRL